MELEADYLVVGAGLAGLAFTDALIAATDATVVIVDRRHAPGGHWLEAYPFVRLHQPSRLYGVASTPFGGDKLVTHGVDEGLYERASGGEICGYFDRVMQDRLLASGQVRFLPRCEYLGGGQLRSLVTGEVSDVHVRRRVVDGTYTDSRLPSSEPPPFAVAEGVDCVSPGELVTLDGSADRYVVVGAGKTSMDTCQWLLDQGLDPDRITWIRPGDAWLLNRDHFQGGALVGAVAEGAALQFEAAARRGTVDDFFEQCNEHGVMLRLDPNVRPTAIRGATSHERELEQLRQIRDVVRLGYVKGIERNRIVLDRGEIPTTAASVHVHCAASGVTIRPPRAIFEPDLITLQAVRIVSPAFSSALIGFLEGTARDDKEKNRLAQPNAFVDKPLGWLRATLQSRLTESAWKGESDLKAWVDGTCLNVGQGMGKLAKEPAGLEVLKRMSASAGPALAHCAKLLEAGPPQERALFWQQPD